MKKMANLLLRLSLLLHSFILFLLPAAAAATVNVPSDETNCKKRQIKKKRGSGGDDLILRQVFEAFDGDKDGLITQSELSASLRRMGIAIPEAELAALIESADANGDGCVDAGEFEELYRTLGAAGEEENGGNCLMEEAFGVFDRDGDGFISEEELKGALEAIGGGGHGRSLEECRRMIQRVDEDGDGRVSFFEFQAMMKDVSL